MGLYFIHKNKNTQGGVKTVRYFIISYLIYVNGSSRAAGTVAITSKGFFNGDELGHFLSKKVGLEKSNGVQITLTLIHEISKEDYETYIK